MSGEMGEFTDAEYLRASKALAARIAALLDGEQQVFQDGALTAALIHHCLESAEGGFDDAEERLRLIFDSALEALHQGRYFSAGGLN